MSEEPELPQIVLEEENEEEIEQIVDEQGQPVPTTEIVVQEPVILPSGAIKLALNEEGVKVFQNVIKVMNDLIEGFRNFYFTPEGLEVYALENSSSAIFQAFIPASIFTTYSVPSTVVLPLSISDLYKVTSSNKKNEQMNFSNNEERLILKIGTEGDLREYRLALHVLEDNAAIDAANKVASLGFNNKIIFHPGYLSKAWDSLAVTAPKVKNNSDNAELYVEFILKDNNNELIINAMKANEDPIQGKVIYNTSKALKSISKGEGEQVGAYDIDLLRKVSALDKEETETSFEYSNEFPSKLIIKIGLVIVMLLVAPLETNKDL